MATSVNWGLTDPLGLPFYPGPSVDNDGGSDHAWQTYHSDADIIPAYGAGYPGPRSGSTPLDPNDYSDITLELTLEVNAMPDFDADLSVLYASVNLGGVIDLDIYGSDTYAVYEGAGGGPYGAMSWNYARTFEDAEARALAELGSFEFTVTVHYWNDPFRGPTWNGNSNPASPFRNVGLIWTLTEGPPPPDFICPDDPQWPYQESMALSPGPSGVVRTG